MQNAMDIASLLIKNIDNFIRSNAVLEKKINIDMKNNNLYLQSGTKLYRTLVKPHKINMQDNDIFRDIPSIINQFSKQAGISTNETNEKFRYLSPAMSVEHIDSPYLHLYVRRQYRQRFFINASYSLKDIYHSVVFALHFQPSHRFFGKPIDCINTAGNNRRQQFQNQEHLSLCPHPELLAGFLEYRWHLRGSPVSS
ncbi:hypothetical protein AGLY_006190, partial [Aphis glycines]